jgi:hypothetical protein
MQSIDLLDSYGSVICGFLLNDAVRDFPWVWYPPNCLCGHFLLPAILQSSRSPALIGEQTSFHELLLPWQRPIIAQAVIK